MSKGKIVTELGDGQYRVTVEMNRGGVDAEKTRLQAEAVKLEERRVAALAEIVTAEGVVNDAVVAYNAAIEAYNTAPPESRDLKTLEAPLVVLRDAEQALLELRTKHARIVLEQRIVAGRLTTLEAVPPDPQRDALCIDGEEGLTGDVGVIEIAHEADVYESPLWLRPGFEGRATYAPIRDGALSWRQVQSPEQTYVNVALLPGVQKWKPTYRTGTITWLLFDQCHVTLDAATSSAQLMGTNQTDTLQYVPIIYRDCNGAAFEVGDRVIVQFAEQFWSAPQVIGFVENPRACYLETWLQVGTPTGADSAGPTAFIEMSKQVRNALQASGPDLETGFARNHALFQSNIHANCVGRAGTNTPSVRRSIIGSALPVDYNNPFRFGTIAIFPFGIRLEALSLSLSTAVPVMASICHTEQEVFVLWLDSRGWPWRLNAMTTEVPVGAQKIVVYTQLGEALREFPVPAPFNIGQMDGDAPYWGGVDGSWTQMVPMGDRLYLSGTRTRVGPVTGDLMCISMQGGVVWHQTFPVSDGRKVVTTAVSTDYLFLLISTPEAYRTYHVAPEAVVQLRSSATGALLATANLAELSGQPNLHVTGIAYTHSHLFAVGHLDGKFRWANGNFQLFNTPVILRFKVDKDARTLVFEELTDIRSPDLWGPPPQINYAPGAPWEGVNNTYVQLRLYADPYAVHQRATRL